MLLFNSVIYREIMVRQDKRILLLDFFREQESSGESFTIDAAANATGYSVKSVRKYISEKLKGSYVHKAEGGRWVAEGLLGISNDEYLQLMSQSTSAKELTPDQKLYKKLIERSLDAFTLALEVYNRPSLTNRVEAFTIMMVNSWELLLKGDILNTFGYDKVFYKNGKSISVSDALTLRFLKHDPVYRNIETLIKLRDQATHLLLPELQPQLSRLFQANVLNYQERYKNQMGNSPLAGQSVGILSLVEDGPEPEIGIIKDTYGEATASEVKSFLQGLESTSKELNSDRFSISIEYQLALVKNPKNADVTLSSGAEGQKAIIITKPKDLNKTHPHYTNDAIGLVSKKSGVKISPYQFQAIICKHKIKTKPDFHDFTDRHRYSEKLIDWVTKNMEEQNNWLGQAVEYYKNEQNKARQRTR